MLTAAAADSESITASPMTDPVFEGPAWFRVRIRRYGPWLALVLPAVLGLGAVAVLEFADGLASGVVGLILGVCAAPGLLVLGAPFESGDVTYIGGIAISIGLWLVIGVIASRVATRNPVASFTDFWRAYRWLAVGVFVGVLAALGASALLVDQSLV